MPEITRRAALASLAAAGTALAIDPLNAQAPAAPPPARAFRGAHEPRALPFDPAKMKGLSEKLLRSHWENNYRGAVGALNAVEVRLDAMRKDKDVPGYVYADLKREELARTGSVVLHERYFANLGGEGRPGGSVSAALKEWFGSVEAWEDEFRKTAAGLAGGSGWVVLSWNLHLRELHNTWAWDHMHAATLGVPLLVLDMYEHAYAIDYGSAAARYVDAFFQNVKWEEVDRRWAEATKLSAVLDGPPPKAV
jgi:Fe-Mn family superoxide dismutase